MPNDAILIHYCTIYDDDSCYYCYSHRSLYFDWQIWRMATKSQHLTSFNVSCVAQYTQYTNTHSRHHFYELIPRNKIQKNPIENSLVTVRWKWEITHALTNRTHSNGYRKWNGNRDIIEFGLFLFSVFFSFFLFFSLCRLSKRNASEHLEITIRTVCVALSKLLTPKH